MISDSHIYDDKKRMMLKAIYSVIPEVCFPPPEPEEWPKTRQLADICNEDIYTARLLLLSLAQEGKILCSHHSIGNSLRWYPTAPDFDE